MNSSMEDKHHSHEDQMGQYGHEGALPDQETMNARIKSFFDSLPDEFIPPEPDTPRGRIMEVAKELFAEKGFEATSTRQIAERAEVNQAMINYYFSSKDLLYKRIVNIGILTFFREVTSFITPSVSIEEYVVEMPFRIFETFQRHPNLSRLLIQEFMSGGYNFQKIIMEMDRYGPIGFRTIMEKFVIRGVESGTLADVPPRHMISFIMSIGYGLLLAAPVFKIVLGDDITETSVWLERRPSFEQMLKKGLIREDKE